MEKEGKEVNETEIEKFWEKEKIYKGKGKKIFSIDTPPPTVSGEMHIGHAFSYAQQDFIARFKRMQGYNVFYPFGIDDNGLPTERLVEKLKNVKSKEMERQQFIELCIKTLKEITPSFIQSWKDIGMSCDFEIFYSTISRHVQKISQLSFLSLLKKNEIYEKEFPTLWCPECQTSIAQAELEDKQLECLFSTIKFYVEGKELLIATTRPEMLEACVAVFVHPKDKRYKHLAGKKARVPIFNFYVPIIADESVDMKKGTGVMMVCSYGDKYDVGAIKKHKLKEKIIINEDGTMKGKFGGSIKEAREKILGELEKKNLLVGKKKILHVVNVHDKCGTEIEFLPTRQWFIKILDKKEKLLEQGRKINWHPAFMLKRYENWVNGLEWDWNISRDRHFGIPIPVWKCRKCKKIILPSEKELPVDPTKTKKFCCGVEAEGEKKVLDTWATSALTPQIAASLAKIKIPFSLRPQGHDIIRTWAFYTITKSFLHEKKIPWKDIAVSGFVTLEGKKLSKSKGIIIEPKKIIEKYSADSLRFWAASSKLGEDINYMEKEVVAGKKFVIKLLNASKISFLCIKKKPKKPKKKKLKEVDRLFLLKLNELIENSTNAFEKYDYARCKNDTVNFFWHVFADNYLEIAKKRIYGKKEEKENVAYPLYNILLAILKLMAPFTPFITEELYQKYFRKYEKAKSIHLASWPKKLELEKKAGDEEKFDLFLEIIKKVRREKSKAQKSLKAEIILTIEKEKKEKLKELLDDIAAVTAAREIREGKFCIEFL